MTIAPEFILTCAHCGSEWDYVWNFPPEVEEEEDITDDDTAPRMLTCPYCEVTQEVEYPAWQSHDDAG